MTREQLAAILWRYEGSPWADTGTDFADEADISPWAAAAVDWARAGGVISGRDGNRFAPKDSASRAEVAMILMNYLQAKQGQPESGPAATPSRPDGDTVATAATPHEQQTLYLWEKGNAPARVHRQQRQLQRRSGFPALSNGFCALLPSFGNA